MYPSIQGENNLYRTVSNRTNCPKILEFCEWDCQAVLQDLTQRFQTSNECCEYLSPESFRRVQQGLCGNTSALTIAAVFVCLVNTSRFGAFENQDKGELLQTIALAASIKQKAKRFGCNKSDQTPTFSSFPDAPICTLPPVPETKPLRP